ncbi:TolC family protein [Chryseotalea sanaruensis]|uniref:TolC family protein n=1 Tax=Chryseotalea sanaruensis TaxID=2482724 RepID=UPI000F8DD09C|nr:TolC family protein [Chryseotalea sanaruensis]
MRTPLTKSLLSLQLLVVLFATQSLYAQSLEDYIRQGIDSNQVLQQKTVMLNKAMLALKIANGMFAPSVGLIGNYTTGDGGRSIALPVGDLLNPVYATLNQLTTSDQFPQIENVNQNFFPKNFYDVRVRTSMPLINTDLVYNKKIQQQQKLLQEYEVVVYKRELVKNIKTAYYNYLNALEAQGIYQSAMNRALESKRVNESLLTNGKGLPAYVLRAESEIESIKAQATEAEQQVKNAKLYFNFLLNRDSDAPINADFNAVDAVNEVVSTFQSENIAREREELLQLQSAVELNTTVLNMKQAFWMPKLSGFVDLGAQAENLKYNNDANYYLIGLQLDMPLFAGFTNRHRIQQSKLDVRNAELNRSLVASQLKMSTQFARNTVSSAYQNYVSAQKQYEASLSYQKLIDKGYKEGVSTFIESIDARNQLTTTQLLLNINRYKVLIAAANLERETAAYSLK